MAKAQEKGEAMKCLGSGAWAGVAGAEGKGEEGIRAGRWGGDRQAWAEDISPARQQGWM